MNLKSTDIHTSSPFDDSTVTRLARMGLSRTDGSPDMEALTILARVYGALFFEDLCDTCADMEKAVFICEELIKQQNPENARQMMISICLQYDAILRPLPDPVWWITGNQKMVEIYVRAFLRHLSLLISGFSDTAEKEG